ncbi:protein phosphatase inhibitor 2 family member C [Ochotona princeps]|uniref:protein phosphatase inhibitor 2 family member C n=1 Tax=Ochotona princeps TaxID=9978 RepID=UPI002715148B|nr:protein phosphatase inhibitor 2 family member C [Ochotona princeps]
MANSSTSKQPIKGILKNRGSTSSSENATTQESKVPGQEVKRKKSQKWDEYNILATTHKVHDFRKIKEPSTAYVRVPEEEDPVCDIEGNEAVTVDMLAKKLAAAQTFDRNYQMEEQEKCEPHTSKFCFQNQEKQRQFEMKRKLHYNEALNIKLARQLISKELQDEDEDGCDNEKPPHDK